MGKRLYRITLISAIVGLVISSVFFWLFYQVETKNIEREFQDEINDKALSYYKGVKFNLESVYSLKAHFDNNEIISASSFADEAAYILSRHNKVQALEWIPRVPHSERSQVEAQGKAHFEGYQFTERLASGVMGPATDRDYYYPVFYLEPLETNEVVMGYDLNSNSRRREVMQRAIASGDVQLSEGIGLIQSDDYRIGVLSLLPLFNTPMMANREESLRGFILGVFDVESIFSAIYRGGEDQEIVIKLWDATIPANKSILFSRDLKNGSPDILLNQYRYTRSVMNYAGRRWVLEAIPSAQYFSSRRTHTPWWVFIVGNVFFGLSTWFAFVAARQNEDMQSDLDNKNAQLNEVNEKLERLTKTDPLTGIANRRYFDEYYELEFLRSKRESKPLALLIFDIDFFKQFNDTYGHQAGDRCLRLVASELERVLKRPADRIARIGGEEFAVLLPNTTNGEVVAKQCKSAIERIAIEHKTAKHLKIVTVSVGMVSASKLDGQTPDSLFNFADSALYQAKSAGRNAVRCIKILPEVVPELETLC
ncbi:CHASE domain-containing protein [Photobacterium sanguinicancri]|uniref:CHASE domain-containing protein n=1 Tax=Photobacterium sanguinicancri TaxID=875932 RepID=UPI0024814124|nr:diguanylate cyclase [Photobacterium sanguinicancri]